MYYHGIKIELFVEHIIFNLIICRLNRGLKARTMSEFLYACQWSWVTDLIAKEIDDMMKSK
jgi:hypothetical protein